MGIQFTLFRTVMNIIDNSVFERIQEHPEDTHGGDGVFLQNGPRGSYLTFNNSCVLNFWWSGITNIGENNNLYLDNNSIFGNAQGINVALPSFSRLSNNCIRDNTIRGIYGSDGATIDFKHQNYYYYLQIIQLQKMDRSHLMVITGVK